MSEEEQLGKLAYETHYDVWQSYGVPDWKKLCPLAQRAWIAAAKAVAENIKQAQSKESTNG